MTNESRLVISARLDNVRHACDAVVEAAEAAGLDERAVYHCQMAVDESLTNIIEHGYQFAGDDREIEVVARQVGARFEIEIIDDSPAFNPLQHEAPDPGEPLDTREPGGWGIYFIRKLMDDVGYRHSDGKNHLILTKNTATEPASAGEAEDGDANFPVRALDETAVIIAPSGRLDSNTSPQLERVLNQQLEHGVIWFFIDMSDVEYIASSGLKVLVATWRRAQDRSGDVLLSSLQPRITEIFEMVGFDMLFTIFPDVDAAIASRGNVS